MFTVLMDGAAVVVALLIPPVLGGGLDTLLCPRLDPAAKDTVG